MCTTKAGTTEIGQGIRDTDKLRLMKRTNANLSEDVWVSQIHDGLLEEIQMALGGHD